MLTALYRLIRTAIKMAREEGSFFVVVDLMSYMTVAKRPCYGPFEINPSYNIILYYVFM